MNLTGNHLFACPGFAKYEDRSTGPRGLRHSGEHISKAALGSDDFPFLASHSQLLQESRLFGFRGFAQYPHA